MVAMRFVKVAILLVFSGVYACSSESEIIRSGNAYRAHKNIESLKRVVDLVELGADSAYVRSILGEAIDNGFDIRYLVDSVGPGGCVVGAVFHIDEYGKVDQKWVDEICE